SGTHVYLVDLSTDEIISQTKTNKSGHFLFSKSVSKGSLIVMQKGYKTSKIDKFQGLDSNEVQIRLEKVRSEKELIVRFPIKLAKGILSLSFEYLLIVSLVFE